MHRKKKKTKKKEERNTQPIQTTITTTTTFQLTAIVRRLAGSGYRNRFFFLSVFFHCWARVCLCLFGSQSRGKWPAFWRFLSLSARHNSCVSTVMMMMTVKKKEKIVGRSAISYLSPAHQFRNSFLHCVISSRKTHHSAPLFEFFRFQKIVENLPAVCSITKTQHIIN